MMEKLFWAFFAGWVLLRGFFLFLAWQGNPAESQRQKVLQYFSEDDIARGKAYIRVGFCAKVIRPYLESLVLLVLIFGGYFLQIYDRIFSWFDKGFWLPSLVFLLVYFSFMRLLSLPFDYYLGFVCEKEMGFSNLSLGGWVERYLKSMFVGWAINAAGILLVLWVFRTFERWWPLLIPVSTTLFGIIITLLLPIVVTPIFYNQIPLQDGELKTRIVELAKKVNIPIEGIYEIDESRYSKHTNAYFTGLFSQKRIVLYDTLIKSHTLDETFLIFAHEVGHWLHNHVFKGLTLAFFGTLFACGILWIGFPYVRAEQAFCLKELWSVSNVPLFMLFIMVLSLYLAPFEAQISQYFERQADQASLELSGLRQTFIDAEIRLARDNHSDLLPHPWRVFWFFSHPPAIERIEMGLKFVSPQ